MFVKPIFKEHKSNYEYKLLGISQWSANHAFFENRSRIAKAKDIKRIRASGHYSQGVFAKVLNVSVKTVQSWESGTRMPSHAALRLLEIVDKGIYRPKIDRKTA